MFVWLFRCSTFKWYDAFALFSLTFFYGIWTMIYCFSCSSSIKLLLTSYLAEYNNLEVVLRVIHICKHSSQVKHMPLTLFSTILNYLIILNHSDAFIFNAKQETYIISNEYVRWANFILIPKMKREKNSLCVPSSDIVIIQILPFFFYFDKI